MLSKAGVHTDLLAQRLEAELDRLPKVSGPAGGPDQVYVAARLNRLLVQAEDEARGLKDEYISVEHVLLAAWMTRAQPDACSKSSASPATA